MSNLESTIIVIVVQITAPLLAALLLSFRRNVAAACVPLVCGAIAVLALTACAFLPFSLWSPSQAQVAGPAVPAVAEFDPAPASTAEEPSGAPLPDRPIASGGIDLSRLLAVLRIAPTRTKAESTTTWTWLATIAIGLALLGLLRFGIGLAGVGIARQRSHRLADAELDTILQQLRLELDCRRAIDLRECDRIGSAATIGWRRPAILLAPNWRTWTAVELRAVLAHEVAHIARRDFAGRLVARLAVAIHCYHPLALWLMRRLELRQEMAADALAARCVGGRDVYLRCLASLALRADSCSVGMLPTFLSRPCPLLRRIAMLHVKEDIRSGLRGWWSAAIVGVLSLLTFCFHGGRPQVLAEPPAPAQAPVAARPPLDVSLVQFGIDKDTVGLYALRVDELLKLPGVKSLLMDQLGQVGDGSELLKLPKQFLDIEQIAGQISLKVFAKQPTPNRAVILTLSMIRFNSDVNWSELVKVFGKGVQSKYKGENYCKVEVSQMLLSFLAPQTYVYLSDSHTLLLLDSEDAVKQAIDGKKNGQPKPGWNDQWRLVEDAMFAIVVRDIPKWMAGELAAEPAEKMIGEQVRTARAAVGNIASKTDIAVLGLEVRDRLSIKLSLKSKSPADSKAIAEQCESIYKVLKALLKEHELPADAPALELATGQIGNELLTTAALRSTEDSVVISFESTNGMKAFCKALADMSGERANDPKLK